MALSIPTITLNDGRAMPLLGLGTYKSTEKEAEKERKYKKNCAYYNTKQGNLGHNLRDPLLRKHTF